MSGTLTFPLAQHHLISPSVISAITAKQNEPAKMSWFKWSQQMSSISSHEVTYEGTSSQKLEGI